MRNLDLPALDALSHSRISNYILPGLDSLLVGASTRIFRNTRRSSGFITPHSHRFDFQCLVLRGAVLNTLYEAQGPGTKGDMYERAEIRYAGSPGEYDRVDPGDRVYERYIGTDKSYEAGDWYGMRAEQIHSIRFSSDAVVLLIEGASTQETSFYLEPVVNGQTINTARVEPWMFVKGAEV